MGKITSPVDSRGKAQAPGKTDYAKGSRIGKDQIEKARRKLDLYKSAKQSLNATIKFNERWYRQRHMEYIRSGEKLTRSDLAGDTVPHYKQGEQVEPVSAWLFNSIQNFHADYMDNFPRANVLPREEGDALEAEKLTRILPSLLDRIGFEAVYSRAGWTKAIQGWTVYTVTWDRDADGGRGEISIGRAKLLNLYWDIEVDDLEASSDVFYLHERDKDELIREYPKLERDLVAADGEYESHRDETLGGEPTKITVVDWYYPSQEWAQDPAFRAVCRRRLAVCVGEREVSGRQRTLRSRTLSLCSGRAVSHGGCTIRFWQGSRGILQAGIHRRAVPVHYEKRAVVVHSQILCQTRTRLQPR